MASKKDMPLYLIEYNRLKDLNQKLKNISDCYFIHDNMIYISSLLGFVEKVAVLPIKFEVFNDIAVLPNTLFGYTKLAKKTRMTCANTVDKIILGDADPDHEKAAPTIELKHFNPSEDSQSIFELYKLLPVIQKYINDSPESTSIKADVVSALTSNEVITLKISDDCAFTITKNIFESLKPTDNLSFYVTDYTDGNSNIKYVIFTEESDICSIHTLGAFINF